MLKANLKVALLIGLILAAVFWLIRWVAAPERKVVQNPVQCSAVPTAVAAGLSAETCERQCDEKLALANEQDGRFKVAWIKRIEEVKLKSFTEGVRYSCDLCQKNLTACEESRVGSDNKLQECLQERNEVRTDLTQARTDLWETEKARGSLQSQVKTGEEEIAKLQDWVNQLRQGVCPREMPGEPSEPTEVEPSANTESNSESEIIVEQPRQFYYHGGWGL